MGGGKAPPAPDPIDPNQSTGEYLFGKDFSTNYAGITDPILQERLIGSEERFRPRYTALELADIETMALGTGDQQGLFDLLEEQSRRAGELQRAEQQKQTAADIESLQQFAPQAVEAYRAADPYSTRLADLSQQQAETLYAESEGELSPERRRMAEQSARMAGLARGREMDNSGIAMELLGREQYRSMLRDEARMAGNLAYGQARGLYGDIGYTILNRPTQSIGTGMGILGQAQQGAMGQMGPQLFDPNVGINMAMMNQQNQTAYGGSIAQANASRRAANIQAGAAIGGAAITAGAMVAV